MPEKSVPARLKRVIAQRAHGCCEYCQSQARFALQPFSIDHIIPKSQGGSTTPENLALACQGCNSHKYNHTQAQDPVSGETVPIYNPRQQRWREHFTWNDDYSLIIGITPVGRATATALQLNRTGLVNLRRVLYSLGEHPPGEP